MLFLVVSCNFGWQLYIDIREWAELQRLIEETGVTVCTFGPPIHLRARFYVELFLILAFIGSRWKGLKHTLLGAIGLSGALITYIAWWQYIFRIMRNAEVGPDAINHFAYLAGGTLVDVAIAAAIGGLFIINTWNAAVGSFRLEVNDQ